MSWQLPIQEIRNAVSAAMSSAWLILDPVARTNYPDQRALQDLLDKKDALNAVDSFTETYFVLTPGVSSTIPNWRGSCGVHLAALPLEVVIARWVGDTPHDDGAVMLARAGALADALFAYSWRTQIPEFSHLTLQSLTTRFPEAEEIVNAHCAPVFLGLTVHLEVE